MPFAATIRLQVETALSKRIPSALTPRQKAIRPASPTGIAEVDALLDGGLPLGAITEMLGPQSSGSTAVALSFVGRVTGSGNVCAWIDVSDALSPESAAEAGVDLSRMLWARCGVSSIVPQAANFEFSLPDTYLVPAPAVKGLHGGGCGGHPRNEIKGLSQAVSGLLQQEAVAPCCGEPQRKPRPEPKTFPSQPEKHIPQVKPLTGSIKPWARIEQAMRVTDLVLQGGGFSVVVLDLAGIAPEYVSRVPLATWFRYRAAAERTQASVLLLAQHACAKSSCELSLRLQPGEAHDNEANIFSGFDHHLHVERRRFSDAYTNVVSMRKPPQRANSASWKSEASWAGGR
jgi:hypothetical protein